MPSPLILRCSVAAVLAGAAALSQAQSGAAAAQRPASDVAAGPGGLGSDRADKIDKSWGDKGAGKASGAGSSQQKRPRAGHPASGSATTGSGSSPSTAGGSSR